MANERNTEELVLNEMRVKIGENNFGYVFGRGDTGNFTDLKRLLTNMGGKPLQCQLDDMSIKNSGHSYPDYIITFFDHPNTILVVECKKSTRQHTSANMDLPAKYAVDGVLFYAKHLKAEYNVLAIAVSGVSKDNLKVNTFYWEKGAKEFRELSKSRDTILEPLNYLYLANGEKIAQNCSPEEISALSQTIHEKLRQIKISEKDKPLFIAGILIAFQDKDFRNRWNSYTKLSQLLNELTKAINLTLEQSDIQTNKVAVIKSSFESLFYKIADNEKINAIAPGESGSLAWFIKELEMKIFPIMNHYEYTKDALKIFYHEFIKYSGGDGKGLGIVLTPEHLTDFMCKLGEINKKSRVADICCGSGSFLVTAMKLMCKDANEVEIRDIKKNQLYGIELDPDLYTLAITNMIIRQDGKSNIVCGDCFSNTTFKNLKDKNLSLGLINPPYAQKDRCELEFTERLLNILNPGGIGVVVVPMSCAIGTKFKEVRERLFKNHTLKAVFSMPTDIFYPSSVNVCVMVWKANQPHDSSKPTFFGYCRDDGFVKRKKLGRIDAKNKWVQIEREWLNLYENKKVVDGKSALQCVTDQDEWLAEAYMESDYSKLRREDFQQTVNNYLAYLVKNGKVYED